MSAIIGCAIHLYSCLAHSLLIIYSIPWISHIVALKSSRWKLVLICFCFVLLLKRNKKSIERILLKKYDGNRLKLGIFPGQSYIILLCAPFYGSHISGYTRTKHISFTVCLGFVEKHYIVCMFIWKLFIYLRVFVIWMGALFFYRCFCSNYQILCDIFGNFQSVCDKLVDE